MRNRDVTVFIQYVHQHPVWHPTDEIQRRIYGAVQKSPELGHNWLIKRFFMPLWIVFFFIHKDILSVNSRNILALARSVLAWVRKGIYFVTPFVIRSVAVNIVLAGRRNHLVAVHDSRWSLRTYPIYDNQWALGFSTVYDSQWTLRTYPNPNSHRKVNYSYRGHQNYEFYCPLIDWMLYWEYPRKMFSYIIKVFVNIGTRWLKNAFSQPTRDNIHQYQFKNPILFTPIRDENHIWI